MLGWVLLALVAYYLYTRGGLPAFGQRPILDTKIDQKLPGGFVIGIPIPSGWRVWRLADGSQVIIQPGAATAPGGWVQGTHNAAGPGGPWGEWVWFNEQTGQMQ